MRDLQDHMGVGREQIQRYLQKEHCVPWAGKRAKTGVGSAVEFQFIGGYCIGHDQPFQAGQRRVFC